MRLPLLFLTGALLSAAPALAHVTLETSSAPQGSYFKAVLKVPHGCAGAATTGLRVGIPEGVISAKPQPKSGWTLATREADYAKTYDSHGRPVSKGVVDIVWSGGTLPDAWYDEFVFQVHLAGGKAGDRLVFPVEQSCGDVVVRWSETTGAAKQPAPTLTLTAPAGGHQH